MEFFKIMDFSSSGPDIDMGGQGVLAPSQNAFDIPYVNDVPWYQSPSLLPGGVTDVDQKSSGFWGFDQSKIPQSLQNVLGSVVEAGSKLAIQKSADLINRGANDPKAGPWGMFLNNFRSTATGAQINAGAQAFSIQNFFANPVVWFAAIAGVILFFVLRK